ncbi:probable receptor-like protein kinase At1g80640 [Nymphaea colorata]|nr:probable receptor-like protein kinase At1g80640 [Nymphaea colorata]
MRGPFCLWFFVLSLPLSLSHARLSPLSSPISSPSLSTQNPPDPVIIQPELPTVLSPSTMAAVSPPGFQNEDGSGEKHRFSKELVVVIIVVPSVLGLVIIFSLCIWISRHCATRRSGSKNDKNSDISKGGTSLVPMLSKFNSLMMNGKKGSVSVMEYAVLESATNNFNSSNILGQGGSGCVYKARFDNNFLAAVKRLDNAGPDCQREFENEIDLMSRIRHPNLVSLLGYCVHGETNLLVYELMQNGTLESQLHGPSHGSLLTWYIRMKIALDAARGLEYLHEHCNPPVIHRDLKSSNILLDSNFNAKLSDFGLAVTVGSHNKANIKLLGTLGYLAPEYVLDGKLTEKSDVYAFGVVLLELLLGRRPVEKMAPSQCQSIVTWAMPQLTDRTKLPNIIDPVIRNAMDLKHLYQVAAVAVLCVQPEPSYRPLITDVLHSLIPLVPVELGGTLRVSEPAIRNLNAKP